MDSSHVSLVSLKLLSEGFDRFRCDRTVSLGLNLVNLSKILKCAASEDTITFKTEESSDLITFVFDSSGQERVSEFDMKLMDIDSEHLTVPDQVYSCEVVMPSAEFKRICSDLAVIGDTCELLRARPLVPGMSMCGVMAVWKRLLFG
jgi:proliferating cell nuclear antigen